MKENQPEQISRRRLLKALTAAGGVIAASFLPGKWAKPVVEVGVLPAHAQVTAETVYRIDCDSTPPSGDITQLTDFCIENVAALLVLVSGVGPVAGVTVAVTSDEDWLFPDTLPWEITTDDGYAGRVVGPDVINTSDDHQTVAITANGTLKHENGQKIKVHHHIHITILDGEIQVNKNEFSRVCVGKSN